MHLYELAMELGERSAELAEAAPSLGFDGLTPTSVLTPEQVAAFRARFAKVPAMAGPGGQPDGAAYQPPTWGPPPGAAAGPPPPAPSGGRGMGLGQMILIAAAVIAVIGLFGYMVKNGGTDQERLDRIASAPPEDSDVPVTKPDGTAFTKEERDNIAKLNAAKAEQEQRSCDVLRKIRNSDIAMGKASKSVESFEEHKQLLIQASEQAIPLYDQAIPVLPDQADGFRKLQQFSRDTIAEVSASSDGADLQNRLVRLAEGAIANGTIDAAKQLDAYAMETCGFSTGNN